MGQLVGLLVIGWMVVQCLFGGGDLSWMGMNGDGRWGGVHPGRLVIGLGFIDV